MAEHQVPVVIEFILERITNVSMGTELDKVQEFEDILCLDPTLTEEGLPAGGLNIGLDQVDNEKTLEPAQ